VPEETFARLGAIAVQAARQVAGAPDKRGDSWPDEPQVVA
jgi:hypothetical protein